MDGHCTGAVRSLCMSLWTTVLTDVQQALRTCGFSPEQDRILIHSMWAGKLFHTNISLPEQSITSKDVTVTMANAVQDYHDARYTRFGEQLGDLMREMIVVSFPQKYEIDERALLREIGNVPAVTEWRSQRATLAMPTCFLFIAVSLVAWRSRGNIWATSSAEMNVAGTEALCSVDLEANPAE